MAKLRSVNTHFWQDDYVCELPVEHKLLFLYLLTCPLSNIAGVYEITRRQMCFDTGLTPVQLEAALADFEAAGKVVYRDNYIVLVNHRKNQKLNPSMEKARREIVRGLPRHVRELYENTLEQDEDTMRQDDDTMPASCTKDKDKDKDKDKVEVRREAFASAVFNPVFIDKYGKPVLQAFFNYWSELNASKTKMRCELQPTWELPRRLATWAAREQVTPGKPVNELLTYREYCEAINAGDSGENYVVIKRGTDTFWVHKRNAKKYTV